MLGEGWLGLGGNRQDWFWVSFLLYGALGLGPGYGLMDLVPDLYMLNLMAGLEAVGSDQVGPSLGMMPSWIRRRDVWGGSAGMEARRAWRRF